MSGEVLKSNVASPAPATRPADPVWFSVLFWTVVAGGWLGFAYYLLQTHLPLPWHMSDQVAFVCLLAGPLFPLLLTIKPVLLVVALIYSALNSLFNRN